MSKIFDNIETKFEDGLHAILTNVGVQRADICVGYFNLRGWKLVADDIERLPGGEALEKGTNGVLAPVRRICRLLIGMQRPEQVTKDIPSAPLLWWKQSRNWASM